jgi:hypothetical protein
LKKIALLDAYCGETLENVLKGYLYPNEGLRWQTVARASVAAGHRSY